MDFLPVTGKARALPSPHPSHPPLRAASGWGFYLHGRRGVSPVKGSSCCCRGNSLLETDLPFQCGREQTF